jgi:GNAT superfamily N-acetyltransferase
LSIGNAFSINAIVPIPSVEVPIRLATMSDIPFIDSLQKKFGKQLGFMADSWLAARIEKGEVLVAEGAGYIISQDKYHKREELGLVVQLCVDPSKQRGWIGAMLVRAAFERAAYGCRLFCLWCAQDIEANHFWESIGFVPLAYRGGSEKKSRVHIFWQKRIREGDTTTPWWFPSKTDQGVMRADRIVLPIPPGKHWSDELPVLQIEPTAPEKALPSRSSELVPGMKCGPQAPTHKRPKVQFGVPSEKVAVKDVAPDAKQAKAKKPKVKADPKLVAAAREYRDRALEYFNANPVLLSQAKYDVTRVLPRPSAPQLPSLPAAA